MHSFLYNCFGAYCEQCNICKRATQVRQLSKFHYRLVYNALNAVIQCMCTKILEVMKHILQSDGYNSISLILAVTIYNTYSTLIEYSGSYTE